MLRNRASMQSTQNGHSGNTYKDKPVSPDLCKHPLGICGIFLFVVFFIVSMINSNGSIFDIGLSPSSSSSSNTNRNPASHDNPADFVNSKHDSGLIIAGNDNSDKTAQKISKLSELDAKLVVYSQEYLHSLEISEIENSLLKSKKLQELFKFEFTSLLVNKLGTGDLKNPTDFQAIKLLSELYSKHNEIVNFIQVGACDGDWTSSNDPIQKLLLRAQHWRGVMMEPVPYLFEKLEKSIEKSYQTNFGIKNYQSRVYLLNAALSDRNGKQEFYTVNDNFAKEMPQETHALKYQIGSFDKNHIIKHLKVKKDRGQLSKDLDHYISPIQVRAMTPDTVVSEFFDTKIAGRDGTIDILLIDAEGYDLVVLQSFMSIPEIRPSIIVYENLHLKPPSVKEAEALLRSYGYMMFKVGWNTMGVRVAEL